MTLRSFTTYSQPAALDQTGAEALHRAARARCTSLANHACWIVVLVCCTADMRQLRGTSLSLQVNARDLELLLLYFVLVLPQLYLRSEFERSGLS